MRGDVVGADDPTFGKLGNRSSEGAIFLARYPPTACCRLKGRASERPLLFAGSQVRTRAYVDGFNLYYGAVKRTPFKWLDSRVKRRAPALSINPGCPADDDR